MIGFASSDAGTLFLLSQDGAQPPADEASMTPNKAGVACFKVAKPSPERRLRSLMIRSRLSPRLRIVLLLTLSLSAFKLFLRTSRRPASNR